MGPKLKPGDKYTLKDGRVVEVVVNPFVLLGLEDKGCDVCCLDVGEGKCLSSRLLTPSCLYLIGTYNYFKWSEDDAEQSEDDNSREDKVS